jgi:hypothetical protein
MSATDGVYVIEPGGIGWQLWWLDPVSLEWRWMMDSIWKVDCTEYRDLMRAA